MEKEKLIKTLNRLNILFCIIAGIMLIYLIFFSIKSHFYTQGAEDMRFSIWESIYSDTDLSKNQYDKLEEIIYNIDI